MTGRCNKCNTPYVYEPIDCPDGDDGCLVSHSNVYCPKCNPKKEGIVGRLMKLLGLGAKKRYLT